MEVARFGTPCRNSQLTLRVVFVRCCAPEGASADICRVRGVARHGEEPGRSLATTRGMSSEGFHEPYESLTPNTRDLHRAITSLREEFEAVDWYQQRIDGTDDAELSAILAHNRDEELEHAMMLLEWLRRKMPVIDKHARRFLFTEGPIAKAEANANTDVDVLTRRDADTSGELGIGSLGKRGER